MYGVLRRQEYIVVTEKISKNYVGAGNDIEIFVTDYDFDFRGIILWDAVHSHHNVSEVPTTYMIIDVNIALLFDRRVIVRANE